MKIFNRYTYNLIIEINNPKTDLAGVNLSGANLYRANLSKANLYRANLYRADLSGANLYRANLSEADLSGANLSEADLSEANLYRANLPEADLSGANLSGASLSKANLSETCLNWSSRDLIAQVLFQWAQSSPERRMIAGLVLISKDWCWNDFERLLNMPSMQDALIHLKTLVLPNDNHPAILNP